MCSKLVIQRSTILRIRLKERNSENQEFTLSNVENAQKFVKNFNEEGENIIQVIRLRKVILLVDNGSKHLNDIINFLRKKDAVIVKVDPLKCNLRKLKREVINGVILSGGNTLRFFQKKEFNFSVIRLFRKKPLLGICLGHEAIAEIFGGKLMPMPESMHGIKNKGVVLNSSCIFSGLPVNFNIGHYHSWIIDDKTLPTELEIIMKDENDFNMAIKHVEYNLTGLQFHPESIMTEHGLQMMKNWIRSI